MNSIVLKKKKVTSLGTIVEIIVAVCISLVFLSDVFSDYRQVIRACASVLAVLIFLYDVNCLKVLNRKILTLNIFLFLVAIINLIFVGNVTFSFLVKFFLIDQSIAFFFLGQKKLTNMIWYVLCAFMYMVIWYCMINSVDGYQLFKDTSRNYVSVYSIFILFILFIVYKRDGLYVPEYLIWHNLILSVVAVGRGGIISAAVLFVLYYIMRIKKNREILGKIKVILFLLVLGSIALYYLYSHGLLSVIWEKYLWRFYDNRAVGSNEERMLMLLQYIQKSKEKIFYILFGTDISKLTLIQYHNGNIHNSYFMLHKAFGMLGIVTLIGAILKSMKDLWKENNYELIVILIVILMRSFLDNCFPYHILNISFLFFVFYGLLKKLKQKGNRNDE